MLKYILTIIISFSLFYNVGSGENLKKQNRFKVIIDKVHNVEQGKYQKLNIYYKGNSADLQSFTFTIAYDGSTLSFSYALAGNIYDDYGWEYFTYRYIYSSVGNYSLQFVNVTGIADYDSVEPHPTNFRIKNNDVFATLSFLVTNDRTKECTFTPINFYWFDSLDNTFDLISKNIDLSHGSMSTGINKFNKLTQINIKKITNNEYKVKPILFNKIKFKNGGFHIACADSIDIPGKNNSIGTNIEQEFERMINLHNYPNPFNPKTTISFDMTEFGFYKLTIINLSGQIVKEFQGFHNSGTVNIEWDASSMASGIYFYKLNTDNFSDTKKMLLLK